MTGSIALDVLIGLIFIYTLYSLLTATVEIVVAMTRLRAKELMCRITRILDNSVFESCHNYLRIVKTIIY